jgi:hypothetical protein
LTVVSTAVLDGKLGFGSRGYTVKVKNVEWTGWRDAAARVSQYSLPALRPFFYIPISSELNVSSDQRPTLKQLERFERLERLEPVDS